MISIWFIWSDTTLFVCQICHWIVKQKKENKIIFFKKNPQKMARLYIFSKGRNFAKFGQKGNQWKIYWNQEKYF